MSGRIGACENEEVLAAEILLLPFGMGKLGEESQFPIGVESYHLYKIAGHNKIS